MTDLQSDARADEQAEQERQTIQRRTFLQLGAAGAAAVAVGAVGSAVIPDLRTRGLLSGDGVVEAGAIAVAGSLYSEVMPTSPLILHPFQDDLAIPAALVPTPKSKYDTWAQPPCKTVQNSLGNESHQIWCNDWVTSSGRLQQPSTMAEPIVYEIDIQVRPKWFTTSQVLPIDSAGKPVPSYDDQGNVYAAGTVRDLPPSTIYGFNGTFPGPKINAEYGRPCLVRFRNKLDENPFNLDRQDFGAPDWSFLTHLHNAHTAPESDGNPHYSMNWGPQNHGYQPGMWVDNLYLNWPAGGDDREKQSFFWFHDHRMDHTGANVYKGMVGLYPIYDPKGYRDMGDERAGLRLPGVRNGRYVNKDKNQGNAPMYKPDGSFDVDYDIPLAFYDCRLDDGTTVHQDMHDGLGEFPDAQNPRTHPEWWGKTFFKHMPNHGFVGDIFTVNGVAYPKLTVKRRRYRLRFLDASIARCYEFKLMSSTKGPVTAASLGYSGSELQGQYRLPDGQQCMKWTEVAADGGIIPFPIVRDSFELWPAKRREMVVDFSKYMDGHPTTKGDVIYLVNVMKMPDGRMWSNSSRFSPDPNYKVPMLKFIIGDTPKVGDWDEDLSVMPSPTRQMAQLPPVPTNWSTLVNDRMIFEVQRGSAGGELEWLINGKQFDPTVPATSLKNPNGKSPLAVVKKNSFAVWEIRNGGGGWVHPFHLHMEEHRVLVRNGKVVYKGDNVTGTDPGHPDDTSKEDLINLDPGESVMIFRHFRDFTGPYVSHCHNLAHEDHAMMFGWTIQ